MIQNQSAGYSLRAFINKVKQVGGKCPDKRTGKNLVYEFIQAWLGTFSVFFLQSPSFLSHQQQMEERQGLSNALTLFGIEKIPTDNHIRDLLDGNDPECLDEVYDYCFEALKVQGYIDAFRVPLNGVQTLGELLVGLDGTWYFSSTKIHCGQCSTKKHQSGETTYFHGMLTPVMVAPGKEYVFALEPEFIQPQDGHEKQDCEIAAGKRWLSGRGQKYQKLNITLLGDDLYCRQPFCEEALEKGFNYLFVCKPESHKTLYEYLKIFEQTGDVRTVRERKWNGKHWENYQYRYADGLPIKDGDDALKVNWCELVVTKDDGKILHTFSFATNHRITDNKVMLIIEYGRTRWKVENENNNTLKNQGYHLEHNFGHGKQTLAALFASMNILAFLLHSLMELMDDKYRLLRAKLPSRERLFNDLKTMVNYFCFDDWEHLFGFMLAGLEKRHRLANIYIGRDPPQKIKPTR